MASPDDLSEREGKHPVNAVDARYGQGQYFGDYGTQHNWFGSYEPLEDARQHTQKLIDRLDLDHFTGRTWLVDEIDQFFRTEKNGYFVLEADAGLGKTTFCAWLARTRRYPHHFVRILGDLSGADSTTALKNLAAQLIEIYRLDEVAPGRVLPPAVARPDRFAELLAMAASWAQQSDQPVVLVVDGLDEVPHGAGEMPLGLPSKLPENAYVIASRRPGSRALPIEGPTPRRYFELRAQSEVNQQDMLDYLHWVAVEEPLAGLLTAADMPAEAFIVQLADKCSGVWIYQYYVLDEIRRELREVNDLTSLPGDLWQYYAQSFGRHRDEEPDRWYAVLLPLLTALGVAGEPVTFDLLCTLANVPATEQGRDVLDRRWRPFLEVQDDIPDVENRYAIYHSSLREFVEGRLSDEAKDLFDPGWKPLIQQLRRAVHARHNQIADRYLSTWGGLASHLSSLHQPAAGQLDSGYSLRHLTTHLSAADRPDDLHRLLACQWTPPVTGVDSPPGMSTPGSPPTTEPATWPAICGTSSWPGSSPRPPPAGN